jgi:prevent-host-death family protein
MTSLQLQRAKAELSRIVEAVQVDGPVVITVRGREKAVLMSKRDYDKKVARGGNLWSFLRASPLRGAALRLERNPSPARDIEL